MMATKVIKIGAAVRNRVPTNDNIQKPGSHSINTHGKSQKVIRASHPALQVRANVRDSIPTVYHNIDKHRLGKHSKTGAKVLSELSESDLLNGESITITLPTDPNAVTADGLHYVLNVVNRNDLTKRINLRLGGNVNFALEIWAAVKALELAAPQGRYRHDLLNKLSGTVPDAETLKKAYLLHLSDPGVYGRALTCAAEHIVNGTIDIVSVEQYLGVTVETMLSRDLKGRIIKAEKDHTKHDAAVKRNARHQEKMWQLENGLRTASEREVHQLTGGNKQYWRGVP